MKKFLKILVLSLIALILVILVGLHIAYHSFSPDDAGLKVNETNLAFFQQSYDECRRAFLEQARAATEMYNLSKMFSIKVPSKVDTALYIDILYLPPQNDSSRLLVLSSGIHGVEAFMGSAFQQFFLEVLLTEEVLSDMGVLMIHGINPYGFKYLRRLTENNVDLNRGSETDPALFNIKNEGYGMVSEFLNPMGKVSKNSVRNQFFHWASIMNIMKYSKGVLQQAIGQGQYDYPQGIMFGGNDFEPQIDSLRIRLPVFLSPYETILAIDLHTGHGERGGLYPLSNPLDNPQNVQKTESVFRNHRIVWGDSDETYTTTGGFSDPFIQKLCPDAMYLHMTVEWGTFDVHRIIGSMHLLQNHVMENQGFNHGYRNSKQEERIKQGYKEFFYPSSESWRSGAIESGREMFSTVLENYSVIE